ncbi:MAG: ATP-binding protein [Candidatus Saganbacteria bacterium]|nr:ATP-binding protein [Candidatus Saganbacteria bacterium]
MSIYPFLLLLLSVLGAGFALLVYVYGKTRPAAVFLALYNTVFSVWCFGQFMGEISISKDAVLFWTRVNLAAAVLIPVVFMLFVYAFLDKIGQRKPIISIFAALSMSILLFLPTHYFINDLIATKYFRFYPQGGPVYIFFIMVFAAAVAAAFTDLVFEYRHSSGTRRNQTAYIILASIIGFGGGVLWFLPAFGADVYPYGIFIVPFYLFIAAYAIVRHNLLDINIVLRKGILYPLLNSLNPGNSRLNSIHYENMAAIGVVAASIAHEIKNPLTAIKGMVQVLPENIHDKDFIASFNDIVPRQIEKINGAIEKLIRFVKSSSAAGGLQANQEDVNIDEMIDDILFIIRIPCEKAGIVIEKSTISPIKIKADRALLSQAFFNIILNSMQAMPSGGDLRVTIDAVSVEISDTGIGIKKEDLPRIFEPFFSQKERGSGVGLAVAAGIIESFGGKIEVDSEPGKGARFIISFKR